jgi:hypothetical protein
MSNWKKISNKNKNNKEKTVLLFIKDRGKKLYRKYVKQKQKKCNSVAVENKSTTTKKICVKKMWGIVCSR